MLSNKQGLFIYDHTSANQGHKKNYLLFARFCNKLILFSAFLLFTGFAMLSLPSVIALSLAIILEVFATSWLPKTKQFTAVAPTLSVLVGYGLAFYLLSITVQSMSLGVAYAIWCGAGIVLVAAMSWLVYGQKLDIYALVGISFILIGTLIINLFSSSVSH